MNLTDYIRSKGRGREARDLELQAMNDPLLDDALDGFLAVVGDHLGAIDRLQKRIAGVSAPHRPSLSLRILCGAAAVFLFGVAGILLLLHPASPALPSAQLPPLAATIPVTQPEEAKVTALVKQPGTTIAATQTPTVSPDRPANPQLAEPAPHPIDTLVIAGFNVCRKAEFTGASPARKPLAEILQEQLRVPPLPLPPDKSWPTGPLPASHPLAADYPADPATHEAPAFEPEFEEFCDRFDVRGQDLDPRSGDLPDDHYGGG